VSVPAEQDSVAKKIAIGVAIPVLTAIVLAIVRPAMVASWLAAASQWSMGALGAAWPRALRGLTVEARARNDAQRRDHGLPL
jgi:hypothetical protein